MTSIEADVLDKEVFPPSPETLRASSDPSHSQIPEETLQGRSEDDQHEDFHPPNGGLEAWLLVLAGFLVFVNTW
jgi:hypothetical protein